MCGKCNIFCFLFISYAIICVPKFKMKLFRNVSLMNVVNNLIVTYERKSDEQSSIVWVYIVLAVNKATVCNFHSTEAWSILNACARLFFVQNLNCNARSLSILKSKVNVSWIKSLSTFNKLWKKNRSTSTVEN